MNVFFILVGGEELEKKFFVEVKVEGFEVFKGYCFVGGARAFIYNVMFKEGVEAFVFFMKDF